MNQAENIQYQDKRHLVKFEDENFCSDEESLEFEQMDFDEKRNRGSLNKKVSPNYFEKPKHVHNNSEVAPSGIND